MAKSGILVPVLTVVLCNVPGESADAVVEAQAVQVVNPRGGDGDFSTLAVEVPVSGCQHIGGYHLIKIYLLRMQHPGNVRSRGVSRRDLVVKGTKSRILEIP